MNPVTVAQLQNEIQGEWNCGSDLTIRNVAEISSAQPGDLVFAVSADKVRLVESCNASFAILPVGQWNVRIPHVMVRNPYMAFAKVLELMNAYSPSLTGVHPAATLRPDALVGESTTLYPGVFLDSGVSIGNRSILYANVSVGMNVEIGDDCIIHANCTIREGTKIGNRVIIQPNAVIGSDGYGYTKENGVHHKIPQLGSVIIEDDVEIGAGSTIDRGTFRETIIGRGTKIDNLVQVGHNVKMGVGCLMAAQSGVSGSTTMGDYVTFGGQSGSVGHISIGSHATIMARGAPAKNVEEGAMISGFPGRDHKKQIKVLAAQERMVGLRREIIEAIKKLKSQG